MKPILTGILSLAILVVPFTANAAPNDEKRAIRIDEKVSIEKFKDGRIAPVKEAKALNEKQIDKILLEMNFTTEEIATMHLPVKQEFALGGGVKVNIKTELKEEVYTDIDGVDHVVTEKNKEEVKQKIQKDLIKAKKNEGKKVATLDMGSVVEGDFRGSAYLTYHGNNGSEFAYAYHTTFYWGARPGVAFTDTIANSWQSNATTVGRTGVHYWNVPDGNYHTYWFEAENTNLYGTEGKIDLLFVDGTQNGYLREEVRIPTSQAGLTGAWLSGYAHPYTSSYVDAILNVFSIDWPDDWALKKTWTNTFTIGQ